MVHSFELSQALYWCLGKIYFKEDFCYKANPRAGHLQLVNLTWIFSLKNSSDLKVSNNKIPLIHIREKEEYYTVPAFWLKTKLRQYRALQSKADQQIKIILN